MFVGKTAFFCSNHYGISNLVFFASLPYHVAYIPLLPSLKTADSALHPHKIFGTSSIDWKSPESWRREYKEDDRKRK
ncbi:hypothetical protein RUND412_006613, partial [Rhizina undulata]